MGINLTEISQKVLDNNKNAANIFRKMYDLHYNPNAIDVPFEYIDENGNITNVTVPNRTTLIQDFNNFKQDVRNRFPVINLYRHIMDFGRDTDSTDKPLGCYGWASNVDRSYSYREVSDDDKDNGFPIKYYIPSGVLICKEHWKATEDGAEIATPNALGYPRRTDTNYITVSFMYRITNATGNFKDRLENAGYICDEKWHKKNKTFWAINNSYKAWWPLKIGSLDKDSEVDFEWAMLIIAPGDLGDLQEYYVEFIGNA